MNNNTIFIFDMDGTLIESNQAIRQQQIKCLKKIVDEEDSVLNESLKKFGMKKTLLNYGLKLSDFYGDSNTPKEARIYKPLDFTEAAKNGTIKIFNDAECVLNNENYNKKNNIVISNSSLGATLKKLEGFDITDKFNHVYAEHQIGKAKPSTYMGEKALEDLEKDKLLDTKPEIVTIGDHERDIEFSNNLKKLYKNIINVLIDRKREYDGKTKPDFTIKTLTDLNNF